MGRAFRQLSAVYVVAAGLYSFLWLLNSHPDLAHDLHAVWTVAKLQASEWADNFGQPATTGAAEQEPAAPPAPARVAVAPPAPVEISPLPKVIAPKPASQPPMQRPKLVETGPSFAGAPARPNIEKHASEPKAQEAPAAPPSAAAQLPGPAEVAN